jgi:hypothetical protein
MTRPRELRAFYTVCRFAKRLSWAYILECVLDGKPQDDAEPPPFDCLMRDACRQLRACRAAGRESA